MRSFLLGLGLGLLFGFTLGLLAERRARPVAMQPKPGNIGPRQLLDPGRPFEGVFDWLRVREVLPQATYESPRPVEMAGRDGCVEVGLGEEDAKGMSRDLHAVEQVTYRDGVLSIFMGHGTSGVREFQFPTRANFDALTRPGEVPRLFERRCWLCDGRVALEGGATLQGPARRELLLSPRPLPYLAADASVAAFSPSLRLVVRPSVVFGGEARLSVGLRYVF